MTAPTVEDILRQTWIGYSLHLWRTESAAIEVPASELRPILCQAYDPDMPNWPSLISYDSEGGWHVA